MGDFEDLRDRLLAHRPEREQARVAALLAAEEARAQERALATARRSAADDAELSAVQERLSKATEAAGRATGRLAEIDRLGAQLVEGLAAFTDPVEGVARLSDRHPILLFPLRLETRFKTSAAGVPQLWVRVYPDECLVDGFEESLTEAEVHNGTAFWAAVWAACGDEGRERAAWRELVAACGAGRSGWVVRQLVPLNPGDKPDAEVDTVRLVVVSPDPQPSAVSDYWAAVWAAHRVGGAVDQARSDLVTALGSAGADAVVANPPVNLDAAAAPGVASPVRGRLGAAAPGRRHPRGPARARGRARRAWRCCPSASCCSATPMRLPPRWSWSWVGPSPRRSSPARTRTPRRTSSSSRPVPTPTTPTRCGSLTR